MNESVTRTKVKAFYAIVDPTRTEMDNERVVDMIREHGEEYMNDKFMEKYGKDLHIVDNITATEVQIPTFDESALRAKINAFYAVMDPHRTEEQKEKLVNTVRTDGEDAVNERMKEKYGMDLTDFAMDEAPAKPAKPQHLQVVPVATPQSYGGGGGAPPSELPMATLVVDNRLVLSQIDYRMSTVPPLFAACCICCVDEMLSVSDGRSTISFRMGCTELPCLQDGKRIGTVTMETIPGGNWNKVVTLRDIQTGQVLARTYRGTTDPCCGCDQFFVLEVVGYQTFRAPLGPCDCGEYTYADQQGSPAIYLSASPCGGLTINARNDIPNYAVAIIPLTRK